MIPLVALVRGGADFMAQYCVKWAGNRVVMDLRNAMFEHLHDLPVAYFSQKRTGRADFARVANDTMLVERSVSTVIEDLAKQPVTLVAMIVWVFMTMPGSRGQPRGVPRLPCPDRCLRQRCGATRKQAQARIADVVSILQETIAGR